MSGFVYAMGAGDLVKIGWSADPQRRLNKVKSDNGAECELLGFIAATREQEAELHGMLAPQRERGEWFRKAGPVLHFLDLLPRAKARDGHRKCRAGNGLRQWRLSRKMTTTQCAEAIGVRHCTISRIERGVSTPSLSVCQRIEALTAGEVKASEFFGAAA